MITLIILGFFIVASIMGLILSRGNNFYAFLSSIVIFSGLFYLYFHMYQLEHNSMMKKQERQQFISQKLTLATQNKEIESYCEFLFKENLTCYNLNNLDPQSKAKCLKLNNLFLKNNIITNTTADYLTNSLIYELQNNYIKKMANIN